MKYTLIVWHDAKTDPPKKDGYYLTLKRNGFIDNMMFYGGKWNAYYDIDGNLRCENEIKGIRYWSKELTKDDFPELVL